MKNGTHVTSNKLNKYDLSLFLAGIVREVSRDLVFVANSQNRSEVDGSRGQCRRVPPLAVEQIIVKDPPQIPARA